MPQTELSGGFPRGAGGLRSPAPLVSRPGQDGQSLSNRPPGIADFWGSRAPVDFQRWGWGHLTPPRVTRSQPLMSVEGPANRALRSPRAPVPVCPWAATGRKLDRSAFSCSRDETLCN